MQEAKKLEDILKELPEDLRKEVKDFALFLLEERKSQLFHRPEVFLNLKINILLWNYNIRYLSGG
jgi:hypothetical protein